VVKYVVMHGTLPSALIIRAARFSTVTLSFSSVTTGFALTSRKAVAKIKVANAADINNAFIGAILDC
jgi:hypothetical protein